MVFFGHVGLTLGAGWLVASQARQKTAPGFRGRLANAANAALDLRWLIIGSMLPDIVDKPLGHWLFPEVFKTGRLFAHSALFVTLLLLLGMLVKRKPRQVVFSLAFGSAAHLLLDQIWLAPATLLWPAMGTTFPAPDIGSLVAHVVNAMLTLPSVYVPEIAGAAVALVFVLRLALLHRVTYFLRTGEF